MSRVAIVGATGAVGKELVACLAARKFPVRELRLLASQRSAGSVLRVPEFQGIERDQEVQLLTEDSFRDIDVAFFSAGGSLTKKFASAVVNEGAALVDNSSAFRMTDGVPLVVPEVNPQAVNEISGDIHGTKGGKILANPNCSTIIMNVPVFPIHKAIGVERVVVSTYQAASGAGAQAMAELEQQAKDWVNGDELTQDIFGRQYIWNLFSHNSAVMENGYNEEENKMINETSKIFGEQIPVTATCVRVPVLRAHCESINLSLARESSVDEIREILSSAPGLTIVDDREGNNFPEPIHASGLDDVLVGRIREDPSQPKGRGFELFVAGDQLLKGAALNAVQIAELL